MLSSIELVVFFEVKLRLCEIRLAPCVRIILFLSICFFVPLIAQAQSKTDLPFQTSSSTWEGYSEFVRLAQRLKGHAQVRPVANLDYGALRPNDSLLIVHPRSILDGRSLSAFLTTGGRIAILDGFGTSGDFLKKFGIQRFPPPTDPQQQLRDNPDFALALPSTQMVAGVEQGQHAMTAGVKGIVTNHPMVLNHPDLTPIIEIPNRSGKSSVLAITSVVAGKGRLFALGDPSIFINHMLRFPGNRAFAAGLIEYLLPDSDKDASQGTLWIVTNQFEQLGAYGTSPSLLEELRSKIAHIIEATQRLKTHGLPPLLITALCGALALWLYWRHFSQDFQREPGAAQPFPSPGKFVLFQSRGTQKALALMELDGILRLALARHFTREVIDSPPRLSAALENLNLSSDDSSAIKETLSELRLRSKGLAHGAPALVSPQQIKMLHNETMRLLTLLKESNVQ